MIHVGPLVRCRVCVRHEVDQAAPGAQLYQPDRFETPLLHQAEHLDVEVAACAPGRDSAGRRDRGPRRRTAPPSLPLCHAHDQRGSRISAGGRWCRRTLPRRARTPDTRGARRGTADPQARGILRRDARDSRRTGSDARGGGRPSRRTSSRGSRAPATHRASCSASRRSRARRHRRRASAIMAAVSAATSRSCVTRGGPSAASRARRHGLRGLHVARERLGELGVATVDVVPELQPALSVLPGRLVSQIDRYRLPERAGTAWSSRRGTACVATASSADRRRAADSRGRARPRAARIPSSSRAGAHASAPSTWCRAGRPRTGSASGTSPDPAGSSVRAAGAAS